MDIVDRLRTVDISWSQEGEWCAEAADEIERLRIKKQVAVEWIKELMDFLEFIYNHPEFPDSSKAYEWIIFQIEMIMDKYNEPIGEER